MTGDPSPLVLDASSLLNLLASRRIREILAPLQPCLVPVQVAEEVRYVRRGGSGAAAGQREAVEARVLHDQGVVTIMILEQGAELTAFVEFARDLDDGEAAACALAVIRGGTLVSDDRKARSLLARRSPGTGQLVTSQILKNWAETAGVSRLELAQVLRDVEERASFRPGRHDPHWQWWDQERGS